MTDTSVRFLGFAFASADLLFELDGEGRVAFAMGASQKAFGQDVARLTGRSWRELIAESDHALVSELFEGLADADRRGPVKVALTPDPGRRLARYGSLSACRLPQLKPSISCVLSLTAGLAPAVKAADGPYALHSRESFFATVEGLIRDSSDAGADLNVQVVKVDGLKAASAKLGDTGARAIMERISAAVRAESVGGDSAAQLAEERFALVRHSAEGAERLTDRIQRAAASQGAEVTASTASLPVAPGAPPAPSIRALRHALDSFVKEGPAQARSDFDAVLETTVKEAGAFTSMVEDRRFSLVYQPVVELDTWNLHHFEVLARFEKGQSPADTIRMAEELEIIEDFDFAVLERAIRLLKSGVSRDLNLAVNICARSLMNDDFMSALARVTQAETALKDRLLFEITESTALHNLEIANARIQSLRDAGFAICLDDFGSGGASLSYLRALSVDIVKIDGQYVRELAVSGRESIVVRHLTELCSELGVATIGEMIETETAANQLRDMGVQYGQGYFFGKPGPDPLYHRPASTHRSSPAVMRGRRVGEVEAFG
jgi:EAL domain-containing protein (putative c-di-GMP-specific phosphodiesterase class I)/GGDEF domain-containing protein